MDNLPDKEWLGITAAAKRLNVHLSTLRRWAENGDVPHMVTPGGHRRFAASDLDLFSTQQKRGRRKSENIGEVWAERALTITRELLPTQNNDQNRWINDLSDESRLKHREIGRQLLGLTMQFISAEETEVGSFMAEAQTIGIRYAEIALQNKLPLIEMTRATIFFRDTMVETALNSPNNRNVQPEANLRLIRKINTLLNTVHLTIVEVYEESHRD